MKIYLIVNDCNNTVEAYSTETLANKICNRKNIMDKINYTVKELDVSESADVSPRLTVECIFDYNSKHEYNLHENILYYNAYGDTLSKVVFKKLHTDRCKDWFSTEYECTLEITVSDDDTYDTIREKILNKIKNSFVADGVDS